MSPDSLLEGQEFYSARPLRQHKTRAYITHTLHPSGQTAKALDFNICKVIKHTALMHLERVYRQIVLGKW